MCGIALVVGDGADPQLHAAMMAAIVGRGESDERLVRPDLCAGTQRLRIVDRDHARQPWTSADGRWVLCYNGEVFTHDAVRAELRAAGRDFRSSSDTEVVLEAFLHWGEQAVDHLRGEFAFAVVDTATGRTYLARDPMGIKPLYYSWPRGRLHVASEVKALVPVGARIHEVPPGHHGWAETATGAQAGPDLHAWFDPYAALRELGPVTDPDEAVAALRDTLCESVRIRVDTDLPVGVVLSGGLDSSIVLALAASMHDDVVAFTIGGSASEDLDFARRLTAELGVRHEVVDLEARDVTAAAVRRAVVNGELTEYGDVVNGVLSLPLYRAIRDAGVKVAVTGDGADELFGGYPMYRKVDAEAAERLFAHRLRNLGRTEVQRVDRASMGQGVEARVPFLDRELVSLAMRIPLSMKIGGAQEKWIIRDAFADVVPEYITRRTKKGMSAASGLHDRARLFRPMMPRWYRACGYELHAPMRRDFDSVLSAAGHDLDRAMVELDRRHDYTPAERARDLVGAARWTVEPALRRRLGR